MKCDTCKLKIQRPFNYERSSTRVQCPECGSFTESQKHLKYLTWLLAILGLFILGYAHQQTIGHLYGLAVLLLGGVFQLAYNRWKGDSPSDKQLHNQDVA